MSTHQKQGMLQRGARFVRDAAAHPGEYFDVFSMPSGRQLHFVINLFIGLLISVGLHAVEHADLGEKAVNLVSDALTRLERSTILTPLEKALGMTVTPGSVVYLDIDRDTYLQWKTPLLTPRDRLAVYFTRAARYGARAVVLDIFTDYPDCNFPDRDARLRFVLASLSGAGSPTKVILPVEIDSGGGVRGSIFDDLVDEKTIFRGIPYGSVSRDRVTRYWIAYGTGKEGGSEKVLWGIPLLAAMVSDGRYSQLKSLEEAIFAHPAGAPERDRSRGITFGDGKKVRISLDNEDIYTQRIRFLMLPDRNGLPYIRSVAYLREPEGDQERNAYLKFFSDKIVVIGNSGIDQKDIHYTPHGNLAGMYIIGNAVSTIREGLQPAPIPWWAVYLFELLAIVVASYAFLYLTAFRANLVASLLMLSVLVPCTIVLYFCFGVLTNAVFPVLGMSLHQLSSKGEEKILRKMGYDDRTS